MFLRQSTAVDLPIGPFLDATDGVTVEPGLTILQADVRLKKGAAVWGAANNAVTAVYEEGGWYEKSFSTTDTNTVGILKISVQPAGAVPVWDTYYVLPAVVFDALFASGANAFAGAAGATTLGATAEASLIAALLDLANGVETGMTPRQTLRLLSAAIAGILSGAGTATEIMRAAVSDSKVRVTATVDASGNRSVVSTDLT